MEYEFDIFTASSSFELFEFVNERKYDGWIPQGGIAQIGEKIAIAMIRYSESETIPGEIIITEPEEPPSSEDWTDIYNSPRFAPTTDTRWVTLQRDLRTKIWIGKYNDAGSPLIKNRTGKGTKLQAGQKVLVYAKPFQADSWRCWELCDPADEYIRFIDAVA